MGKQVEDFKKAVIKLTVNIKDDSFTYTSIADISNQDSIKITCRYIERTLKKIISSVNNRKTTIKK